MRRLAVHHELHRLQRVLLGCLILTAWAAAFGCNEGAPAARKKIRTVHAREVKSLVAHDIDAHLRGVTQAATKLAPGFSVEEPARETQMRAALKRLQQPPRAISEFVLSPMSFLVAIGNDGKAIARDVTPDGLRGYDFARRYALVREAAASSSARYGLIEFEGTEGGAPAIPTMLFVAPSFRNDERQGLVAAGIPLWRMAQRLSQQLQLDHVREKGVVLWVYLYHRDDLHFFGTPPDLDPAIPDAAARREGLAGSPGGFTAEKIVLGRWYAFGVVPLPKIGPDVGAVIVRSDPM